MDTFGPYTLVKARTIFPESAHPHDTQVTRTLHMSRTQLISTVYARTLCSQCTRHVQDLRPHLRAQSIPANYVYNLRAQRMCTTYGLVWCKHVTRTTYPPNLRVQPTS